MGLCTLQIQPQQKYTNLLSYFPIFISMLDFGDVSQQHCWVIAFLILLTIHWYCKES